MGQYISVADLLAALGETVLNATADDDNDGTPDPAVLALVIEEAEAEVDSYLYGFFTLPLMEPTDPLVRLASLDFAVAFLMERHPEYVRDRDAQYGKDRYARAQDRILRVQQARQRLPREETKQTPKNVGGIVIDGGTKFFGGVGEGWGW